MFPAELQEKYRGSFGPSTARYLADRETMTGAWGCYNSTAEGYSKLFAPVLDGKTLFDLAVEIKTQNNRLIGLDLCGQGDFLTELEADKSLSVCLRHDFRRCRPAIPSLEKWDADLMENQTWERIDRWVSGNGNPDLIVCSPGGAADKIWEWGRGFM